MSLENDLIEHLTSQERYLETGDLPEFLLRLVRVSAALRALPLGAALLSEMLDEHAAECRRFTEADRARMRALRALRAQLASLAPDLEPAPCPAVGDDTFRMPTGIAYFDTLSDPESDHEPPHDRVNPRDPSVSGRALRNLGAHIDRVGATRPEGDLDDVESELWRLRREHDADVARLKLHAWGTGAAAAARIDRFVRSVERGERGPRVNDALLGRNRSGDDNDALLRDAVDLKRDVARFYEEARSRARARRSTAWVMHRFKARCEHYDAAQIADIARRGKGQPETRLTNELSRFLFDAGLNPLSRPMLGSLQPDVLAGAGAAWLFVEAKQYVRRDDRRLRRGAYQLRDYVATARGSGFDVEEAYFVIFRRSGPLYEMPPPVTLGGVSYRALLIDVAGPHARGSNAKSSPASLEGLFDSEPGR